MCRRLLLLLSIVLITVALNSTEEEAKTRPKRHYYGGYDYGYGDDYWYAGRIFGIIAGSLLFLLCCCTPCICLAGIWFMGWFGLRAKRDRKSNERAAKSASVQEQRAPTLPPPPPSAYSSSSRQPREVIIDTAPPPRSREHRNNDHIIYEAEDRFYSSSAPVTDSRPYRTSNF